VAAVMDEVKHFADLGVTFEAPKVDLAKLKTHKEKVIGKPITNALKTFTRTSSIRV
jgi:dihydrolipoamide dehydrogenase